MNNNIYDITYTNDCPFYHLGYCKSEKNYRSKCDYNISLTMLCEHREKENIKIINE